MNNLYSDVNKIYDEYFNKKKIADKKFVEKTIDIVLNADETYNLVTNIEFKNLNNSYASYNYSDRTIKINNSILTSNEQIGDEIDIAANNANILHYILHECTHIRQINKIIKDEDSIESKILKYTIVGNEIQKEKLRNLLEKIDNPIMLFDEGMDINSLNNFAIMNSIILSEKGYNLSPAERMAEYRSIKIMQDIIKNSKYGELIDSSTNLSTLIDKFKSNGYLKRKDIIFSPTERYFKFLIKSGIKGINNYIDEILKNEMNLEDRLYHGLPITYNEYKMVKALKHK